MVILEELSKPCFQNTMMATEFSRKHVLDWLSDVILDGDCLIYFSQVIGRITYFTCENTAHNFIVLYLKDLLPKILVICIIQYLQNSLVIFFK